MKNNTLTIVIVALIAAAVAFFAGMKYQQSKATANNNNQFVQRGQNRFTGRTNIGEIINQDGNIITIKLPDGSSKIINTSDSTTYSKTDKAEKSDLKTGERIAVIGTENSDGSITAQNVQLNPQINALRNRQPSPVQ